MSQIYFIPLLLLSLAIRGLGTETYDVVSYGAQGDGETDDTKAFINAWYAACEDPNSPTLVVPQDKLFLLGLVCFEGPCKSKIHVQIDGNIVAPGQIWKEEYMDHWITFKNIEGLDIYGTGQIDGQGSIWWPCKYCNNCPKNPDTFAIMNSQCVNISGLTFINSPAKHITINHCIGVYISGLTITAPGESPNTDGIHIGDSQLVEVTNSTIGTGDDCISIGSNSININISYINCGPGHGISVGSLGQHGSTVKVERIHVHDCHLYNTTNGVRIKTWQGGFGYARGITFENVNFTMVKRPIIIDQYYCDSNGHRCPPKSSCVHISDVKYIGAIGSTIDDSAISLNCSQIVACSGIFMKNINISSATPGVEPKAHCINAEGIAEDPVSPNVPCLS